MIINVLVYALVGGWLGLQGFTIVTPTFWVVMVGLAIVSLNSGLKRF